MYLSKAVRGGELVCSETKNPTTRPYLLVEIPVAHALAIDDNIQRTKVEQVLAHWDTPDVACGRRAVPISVRVPLHVWGGE